jgi:hypothetical protein
VTVRRGLVAIALLLPVACSSSTVDQHQYLPPSGNGGVGGRVPSGMVVVQITSPADQSSLAVNSNLMVTATVDVQGGTDFIDTSSVSVALAPSGGMANVASGLLVSGGGDGYAGQLSLGDIPAGSYTLTVSAKSSSGMQASNSVTIVVDGGPVITILSPQDGHGYNGSAAIDFHVDPGAAGLKADPTATIAGMPIALTPPDAANPDYRATVAFGPTTPPPAGVQSLPPLSGEQLFEVRVTNANDVTATARVTFKIDTAGPVISLTTPSSEAVVGGVVKISATITDDSGVLDSSVVAVISDKETPVFELPLTPEGSGIYGTLFDTANLTRCPEPPATDLCVVFPTISFRAVDLVGNQTVVSYGFGVDNVAPIADLDPPEDMRQMRLTATGYECSFPFDPLSLNETIGDMPDDGCLVPQVFDLKARIEDDGNRASEVKATPISLVDPANTNVFIMPMTGAEPEPLVVDSNGDGRCDEVNPLLLPASPTVPAAVPSGILEVRLAPVPPAGEGDFRPDSTLPADAPCGVGTAAAPAKRLCNSFAIPTIAIAYSDNEPAVWSVEPIDNTFHCLGNQVDMLANHVPEGWACIAVQTRDLAGNQSVSVPIRVYVQYAATGAWCQPPPAGAPPPPTCTGVFDPAAKTAAFGACTARKFPRVKEYYCAAGGC